MARSKTLFSILIHLSLMISFSLADENGLLASNNNIFQESEHTELQMEKILQDQINEIADTPIALQGKSLAENIAFLVNVDPSQLTDDSISDLSVLEQKIQDLFAHHKIDFFEQKYDNFLEEAKKLVNKYIKSCMLLKNDSQDCSFNTVVENSLKKISEEVQKLQSGKAKSNDLMPWFRTVNAELNKNLNQNVNDIAFFKSFRNNFSKNIKLQLKLLYLESNENPNPISFEEDFARFVSIHNSLKDEKSVTESLELFKYYSRLYIKNQLSTASTTDLKLHSLFLTKIFNEIANSYPGVLENGRTITQDLVQNYFYSHFGTTDSDLSFCSFMEDNLKKNGWNFIESNEGMENLVFDQIHIANSAYCLAIRDNFSITNENLQHLGQNINQLFEISPQIIHHIGNRPSIFFSSNFKYGSSENYDLYENIYNLYKRSVVISLAKFATKLNELTNEDLIHTLEHLVKNYNGEIVGGNSSAPLDLKNYYVIIKLFLTIHELPYDFTLEFSELKDVDKSKEMLDSFNATVKNLDLAPLTSHINNLFKTASINQGLENADSIFQLISEELSAEKINSTHANK